jgi:hypothetical protein
MFPGNAMIQDEPAFHHLSAYTLTRGDAAFIHQHVVDAYAAQHADANTKPIKLTFALVGLYLLVEQEMTGRQVQRVHMRLARQKHQWPAFMLPHDRGGVTAADVMKAPEGPGRDRAIHDWCRSVWAAFSANREVVAELLKRHGTI